MKWYVCACSEDLREACNAAVDLDVDAEIVGVTEPQDMRTQLLQEVPCGASALIYGELEGVEPINLAAAIVADGHAQQVVLVCRRASGSLRSRAQRAGIDRVLTVDELNKPDGIGSDRYVSGEGDSDRDEESARVGPSEHMTRVMQRAEPAGAKQDVQPMGATLCLVSGRGGVGKTTIACLMALIAEKWKMSCALVDLDLSSGNLFSYVGLQGAADLSSLADYDCVSERDVSELGVHVTGGLKLWGPCARPEMAETLGERVTQLLEILAIQHDLVIVDTSTTFTDAVAQAVQGCDRLLVVADETRGCVGSLARAASLSVRLGVARTRIVRIMNHADPHEADDAARFRDAVGLETARAFRLAEAQADLTSFLGAGRAADFVETEDVLVSSTASCLAAILSELGCLPEGEAPTQALSAPHTRPKKGFLSWLREAS